MADLITTELVDLDLAGPARAGPAQTCAKTSIHPAGPSRAAGASGSPA